eukprot:gnl/TRDRNA2_/TRDRNA2_42058_c0_seq2.p1 gnl/TRDRNA2_/TRDRNA2_42058_c0~~gnl/TRDRNA2_/TRDRNA2_42058_c0_seq2.p1  ORF type:complete len:738 (+),score=176.48 gnl/TRDRNA2_/TRDRNA2_42058_c0_seq2:151-2364(+)
MSEQRTLIAHKEVKQVPEDGEEGEKKDNRGKLFREVNKLRKKASAVEVEEHGKWNDSVCGKIAASKKFDILTLIIIVANSVWIGVDTEFMMNPTSFGLEKKPDNLYDVAMPSWYVFFEQFFCVYFTGEFIIKFFGFTMKRDCLKDYWFLFDAVLVTLMVAETWVVPFLPTEGGSPKELGLLRMLRLLRITRMARLMRSVPELMTIVRGIIAATRTVSITAIFLFFITYTFSIIFTMTFHEGVVPEPYMLMAGGSADSPGGCLTYSEMPDGVSSGNVVALPLNHSKCSEGEEGIPGKWYYHGDLLKVQDIDEETDDLCATWDTDTGYVIMAECVGTPNQMWRFEEEDYHKVGQIQNHQGDFKNCLGFEKPEVWIGQVESELKAVCGPCKAESRQRFFKQENPEQEEGECEEDDGSIQDFFGTMGKSFFSLIIMGMLLDDLTAATDMIRQSEGSSLNQTVMLLAFIVFIIISSFTVLNMLIGILVEVVSATAEGERLKSREGAAREAITNIWLKMDKDADGMITKTEFIAMKEHKEVIDSLEKLSILPEHFNKYADILFTDDKDDPDNKDLQQEPSLSFNKLLNMIMRLRPGTPVNALEVATFKQAMYDMTFGMKDKVRKIEMLSQLVQGEDTTSLLESPREIVKNTLEGKPVQAMRPAPTISTQSVAGSTPAHAGLQQARQLDPNLLAQLERTASADIIEELQRRLGMAGNMASVKPGMAEEEGPTLGVPQPEEAANA